MADRWNQGKPSLGDSFDPGFISPWNENVRKFSGFETLETIPSSLIPGTMAEQMDGDQQTTFTGGGKRRKR